MNILRNKTFEIFSPGTERLSDFSVDFPKQKMPAIQLLYELGFRDSEEFAFSPNQIPQRGLIYFQEPLLNNYCHQK